MGCLPGAESFECASHRPLALDVNQDLCSLSRCTPRFKDCVVELRHHMHSLSKILKTNPGPSRCILGDFASTTVSDMDPSSDERLSGPTQIWVSLQCRSRLPGLWNARQVASCNSQARVIAKCDLRQRPPNTFIISESPSLVRSTAPFDRRLPSHTPVDFPSSAMLSLRRSCFFSTNTCSLAMNL